MKELVGSDPLELRTVIVSLRHGFRFYYLSNLPGIDVEGPLHREGHGSTSHDGPNKAAGRQGREIMDCATEPMDDTKGDSRGIVCGVCIVQVA